MPTPESHKFVATRLARYADRLGDIPTPEQAQVAVEAAEVKYKALRVKVKTLRKVLDKVEKAWSDAYSTQTHAVVIPQILEALQSESGCEALDVMVGIGRDYGEAARRGWAEPGDEGYVATQMGKTIAEIYRRVRWGNQ